jgi:hypothetical protein
VYIIWYDYIQLYRIPSSFHVLIFAVQRYVYPTFFKAFDSIMPYINPYIKCKFLNKLTRTRESVLWQLCLNKLEMQMYSLRDNLVQSYIKTSILYIAHALHMFLYYNKNPNLASVGSE